MTYKKIIFILGYIIILFKPNLVYGETLYPSDSFKIDLMMVSILISAGLISIVYFFWKTYKVKKIIKVYKN